MSKLLVCFNMSEKLSNMTQNNMYTNKQTNNPRILVANHVTQLW